MSSVWNVPSTLPFVDAVADGLLTRYGDDPLELAAVTVILPSRRAARALRDACLRRSDGAALILPRFATLGDLDGDDSVLAGTLDLDLPPGITTLRRHMLLAELIRRAPGLTDGDASVPIDQAARLAAELAELLDGFQTSEVPLARLADLVPSELAHHWQDSRRFLAILDTAWPALLEAERAQDPSARRVRTLHTLAERWRSEPPADPILVAGLVDTSPAVLALLRAVRDLPAGAIILPGLDTRLDPASREAVETAPSHPQHMLRRMVRGLDIEPEAVPDWPVADRLPCGAGARADLMSETMRPATTSEAWAALPPLAAEATRGLAVEVCPDLPSEALMLACRLREALEVPGRTASLVTADRGLARRVAAELTRWDIDVDDSAGTPLDQTPPGQFLLLAAHLIEDGADPVNLLALLKHPLARDGDDQGRFRERVRRLELRLLRGPRIAGGIDAVQAELALRSAAPGRRPQASADLSDLAGFLDEIVAKALPFTRLADRPERDLRELLHAHLALAEWLGSANLWAREAGEAARRFVAELDEAAQGLGPIAPRTYPGLLAVLMAGIAVRPRWNRHPRLAILGVIEARLQHADLVLLGGLNEESWPRALEPGPWLSRTMRERIGLPSLEEPIGRAAHDFVQQACAPDVVLSRAEKDADLRPTVPARWLERLRVVLQGERGPDGAIAFDAAMPWSARLEAALVPPITPAGRPQARPPVAARPRRLSVSDVELWMRDPYGLYAKRILDLAELDPLDADAGAAERGTLIHDVLAAFAAGFDGTPPDDALDRLERLGRDAFARFAHRPHVHAIWWPRFLRIAAWYVERERERRPAIGRLAVETRGELALPGPAGPFTVHGRADRIEMLQDGGYAVIDYKTGTPPSAKEVAAGFAPQLPLEAAILDAGGFADLPAAAVDSLEYWQLKGGTEAGRIAQATPADLGAGEAAARLLDQLIRRIAAFDRRETPYIARPFLPFAPRANAYDHLERVKAWAGEEDGG
ncbi:double-strand break repair protein AddB [Marinivivus vitaminiproducens]|uniref:double-strand break repair protein AddB n=1 Tax=Marinivivus vitaminiproducens TaxID=3035935 RepID=UPI0027AA374C|nr:double-strand break repair protein AddB [Geminicoccaceae bacterium SCSIO 64248]